MRILAAVLCLLAACRSTPAPPPEPWEAKPPFDSITIYEVTRPWGTSWGTSFVLMHVQMTAAHVGGFVVGPELGVIAESPQRGFEHCDYPHAVGDSLTAHTIREGALVRLEGEIVRMVVYKGYLALEIRLDQAIYPGMSGSPVLCSHGEVVALLTHRMEDEHTRGIAFPVPGDEEMTLILELLRERNRLLPSFPQGNQMEATNDRYDSEAPPGYARIPVGHAPSPR